MTLAQRIAELTTIYGSRRALARALCVDHAYLARLESGEKSNPSDALLQKLGLRAVVTVDYVSLRERTTETLK